VRAATHQPAWLPGRIAGFALDALLADRPKRAGQLLGSRRSGPYLGRDDNGRPDFGRPDFDRPEVERGEQLAGELVLTANDDTRPVADIALGYKGMGSDDRHAERAADLRAPLAGQHLVAVLDRPQDVLAVVAYGVATVAMDLLPSG